MFLYKSLSFTPLITTGMPSLSTSVIMDFPAGVFMELISVVSILLVTFLLSLVINFLFTMYHLYMRKKSEYQYRLLNLLYGQLAVILQLGSLLNIVIIVRCVFLLDNDIFTPPIQLTRSIQVLTGFLQSTLLGGFNIDHKFCKCFSGLFYVEI